MVLLDLLSVLSHDTHLILVESESKTTRVMSVRQIYDDMNDMSDIHVDGDAPILEIAPAAPSGCTWKPTLVVEIEGSLYK